MNNSAAVAQESAFEIRFGQVGLAQMRIRSTDADALRVQLAKRVAAAPALFERAALCLDLSPLDHDVSAAELRPMLDAIRRCGVLPVGLAHGTAAIEALARELELPVLTQFRAQQSYGAAVASVKAVAQPPAPVAPVAPIAPAAPVAAATEEIVAIPALMHHRPVRSGQRIKTGSNAKVAQLVERDLAKVEVAGSNPVFRSRLKQKRRCPPQRLFCFQTIPGRVLPLYRSRI